MSLTSALYSIQATTISIPILPDVFPGLFGEVPAEPSNVIISCVEYGFLKPWSSTYGTAPQRMRDLPDETLKHSENLFCWCPLLAGLTVAFPTWSTLDL